MDKSLDKFPHFYGTVIPKKESIIESPYHKRQNGNLLGVIERLENIPSEHIEEAMTSLRKKVRQVYQLSDPDIIHWEENETPWQSGDLSNAVLNPETTPLQASIWEQVTVDHLHTPIIQETSEQFRHRLARWRNLKIIEYIADLPPRQRDSLIGNVLARFGVEPDLKVIEETYFSEAGEKIRTINEDTPSDELLLLLRLGDSIGEKCKEASDELLRIQKEYESAKNIFEHTESLLKEANPEKDSEVCAQLLATKQRLEKLISDLEGMQKRFDVLKKKNRQIQIMKLVVHEQLISRFILPPGRTDRKLLLAAVKYLTDEDYRRIMESIPLEFMKGGIGKKGAGLEISESAFRSRDPKFYSAFVAENSTRVIPEEEELQSMVRFPKSVFIGSGVMSEVSIPGTDDWKFECEGMTPEEITNYTKALKNRILKKELPANLTHSLYSVFKKLKRTPYAVRSSGLFEDGSGEKGEGQSGAGVYDTVKVPNQGENEQEEFQKFIAAYLEVFASLFSLKAYESRKIDGTLYENNQMGEIIQPLEGEVHENADRKKKYFYPISGVAYSRAPSGISEEIHARDGYMKIAVGFGDAVVHGTKERVASDGSIIPSKPQGRVIYLSKPEVDLRPGFNCYQTEVYAVDILENSFKENLSFSDVMETMEDWELSMVVSKISRDGKGNVWGRPALQPYGNEPSFTVYPTFEGVANSHLPMIIKYVLKKLEHTLGYPVDIEFTAKYNNENKKWQVTILQCRPQVIPDEYHSAQMPNSVPQEQKLLTITSFNSGYKRDLEYLVYIDPEQYQKLQLTNHASTVAKVIEKIDAKIAQRTQDGRHSGCLFTPGRFGTENPNEKGLPLHGDLASIGVIVECTDENYPLASLGAHDFQRSVVEGKKHFVTAPLPKEADTKNSFLSRLLNHNCVADLFKEGELSKEEIAVLHCIRVVHIESAYQKEFGNLKEWRLQMAMDEKKSRCDLYISEKGSNLPIVTE